MLGNFRSTCDHSRSAAQFTMLMGETVIITSTGESGEVKTMPADDPMWMHTTVPSSSQACQNGSQYSSCRLGRPSFAGLSVKLMA